SVWARKMSVAFPPAIWTNCRGGHIARAYRHKASHGRNGTRRMTSRSAPQPFTASCISLDLIGDLGPDLGQARLLVGKDCLGHPRLLPTQNLMMVHTTLIGFGNAGSYSRAFLQGDAGPRD